jgi:hypothetical protein
VEAKVNMMKVWQGYKLSSLSNAPTVNSNIIPLYGTPNPKVMIELERYLQAETESKLN